MRIFLSDNRGSVIVLVALGMAVLCAMAGLVLDTGNLYLQETQMQSALDAACLAGAQELPDQDQAAAAATQIAAANGIKTGEMSLTITDIRISARATRNVHLALLNILGFRSKAVNAVAAAEKGIAPCFGYTIFSGSTSSALTLSGNAITVVGSVHTNQNLVVSGNSITIAPGACEAAGTATISGNNINIPHRLPHASVLDMPDYTAPIIAQATSAGSVYHSSQTFAGNHIDIADSLYIKGNATLSGNTISGRGALLATGNITISGNCLGAATDDQICLYAGGNITISGNDITVNGMIYAPNGTITISGNNPVINGNVIGKKIVCSGNNPTFNGTDNITCLPGMGAKLIPY